MTTMHLMIYASMGATMDLYIRAMRKRAGMTQADLADAMGINISTIGNWEREITTPDAEQLWNCAVALGCTPNDLLGWSSDGDATPACAMTDTERDVLADFRQSSPAWQSNIAATAKLAANESKED